MYHAGLTREETSAHNLSAASPSICFESWRETLYFFNSEIIYVFTFILPFSEASIRGRGWGSSKRKRSIIQKPLFPVMRFAHSLTFDLRCLSICAWWICPGQMRRSLQRNKSQLCLFIRERWRCDTPPSCHSDNTFISRAIATLSPKQHLFVFMPVFGTFVWDERLGRETLFPCFNQHKGLILSKHPSILINWLCPTV